jgi:hypothetical protein
LPFCKRYNAVKSLSPKPKRFYIHSKTKYQSCPIRTALFFMATSVCGRIEFARNKYAKRPCGRSCAIARALQGLDGIPKIWTHALLQLPLGLAQSQGAAIVISNAMRNLV